MNLDDIINKLAGLPEKERNAIAREAVEATKGLKFIPSPGPQSEAYFSQADVLLYGGSPGGGKGLALDTPIPTPSGWSPMGSLVVGSEVFDHEGKICTVLAVSEVNHRDCYRLVFDDGSTLVADDVHRWVTFDYKERHSLLRSSPAWKAARRAQRPSRSKGTKSEAFTKGLAARNSERARTHESNVPAGTMRDTLEIQRTLLRPDGGANHAIRLSKAINTADVALPVPPYTLGAWLGDGTSASGGLTGEDPEIWQRIEDDGFEVTHSPTDPIAHYIRGLKTSLRGLCVLGDKHIPQAYLRASIAQRLALLQGLMDTDGHAARDGGCEFDNTNERLAKGVHELALSLGLKATILKGKAKLKGQVIGDKWRVRFTTTLPVFHLTRKAERVKAQLRAVTSFRYIVACEKIDSVPTRCIAVDSPSHQYLAGRQFIPTHNTALEVGLALNCHQRSMIVRRNFVDLDGVLHTLDNILGQEGSAIGGNRPKYRKEGGGVIDFVGLGEDIGSKQGNPHDLICVGKETPVLMADGSFKEAQAVSVGDMVATLEGPKKVLNAFATPPKKSIRVTLPSGVSQVQSATHKLLTTKGWHPISSALPPSSISEPSGCRVPRIFFALSALRYLRACLPRALRTYRSRPCSLSAQAAPQTGLGDSSACGVCKAQASRGSACAKYGGKPQGLAPRVLSWGSTLAQRILPQGRASLARSVLHSSCGCDACDAPRKSAPQDCRGNCSTGSHLCGEHIPLPPGQVPAQGGDQQGLLLLADAGQHTPTGSLGDAGGIVPKRTPHTWSYAHPYTGRKRQSNLSMKVAPCSVSPVGFVELFDLEVEEVNHFITLGGFVNKNCVDEAAQVPESHVRMLLGWLRTDIPGQRCRMVLGSNPPLNSTGDWLISFFAPWLDPQHHNPAKEGELRYYLPNDDGIGDRECAPDESIEMHGVKVTPQSRTFISSKFTDNPYYDPEQYAKSLAGLPDDARKVLISGNFLLTRNDDVWQAIPTAWIREAQERWTAVPPVGVPMCAIGVDVAQGGADDTVLAPRRDGWFAPLIIKPGKETPDGKVVAGLVIQHRRDNAKVIVDIGGGWGGDAFGHLRANQIDTVGYMGVKASSRRTVDKQLKFFNVRAEAYWRFREALDPSQEGGSSIALPPDAVLVADLCAPTYEIGTNGIKIEPKEKVCDRIGRSPDRGDAVVMAWWDGLKQANVQDGWKARNKKPQVVMGRKAAGR